MCKKYNGWTNYETWNINQWLDQIDYFADLDADSSVYDLAAEIKSYVEEGLPDLPAGMYQDLLSAAISECNFREIAESALYDI